MKTLEEMIRISNIVNIAMKNNEWEKAEKYLLEDIDKYPEGYWSYTVLSQIYVNLKQYDKALYYGSKAMDMNPDDPLVAYNYADALMYNNRLEEGIGLMKEIVNDDINYIAYGPYGEGLKYAKSLIGDSLASIGYAYLELKDTKNACKYFKQHLKKRQRGIYSDFTKKGIENELKKCEIKH